MNDYKSTQSRYQEADDVESDKRNVDESLTLENNGTRHNRNNMMQMIVTKVEGKEDECRSK